jgi:NodT family efflux transporter outer membrane factor (OMF) lipoprotein
MKPYFTGFVVTCLLTACSVGPNYTPPMMAVPADWSTHHKKTRTADQQYWWRDFHDPLLNELIEQESVHNLDLKTAQARVDMARADYNIAFAQFFPKASVNLLPPDGTGTGLAQLLALSATIEPDLFGKLRQNRNLALANLQANQATRDYALLNLQAEIASTYLEYREAQQKETILLHNLNGNQNVLGFLNSRYKSGLSNYLDTAQQEALIATQNAEMEQNRAITMMLLHKLELLTGNFPGVLSKRLSQSKPLPQITHNVTLGVPSELLRRRPDIIAAERRVAATHANIRVAMANLFPQISVGWLLAWQAQTLSSNLVSLHNSTSTFLGTFNAPILNLSLHQMVSLREREKALAVIQYELAVIRALHDVETQHSSCTYYQRSANYLKRAVEKKRLVLKLAKNVYQKGTADFNTVYNAEEDLSRLEVAYLHTVVLYQISKINLYKALGGGYGTTV